MIYHIAIKNLFVFPTFDCTIPINAGNIANLILNYPEFDDFVILISICFIIKILKSLSKVILKFPLLIKNIFTNVFTHPLSPLKSVLIFYFLRWNTFKRWCCCNGESIDKNNEVKIELPKNKSHPVRVKPDESFPTCEPIFSSDQPKLSRFKIEKITNSNKYKYEMELLHERIKPKNKCTV